MSAEYSTYSTVNLSQATALELFTALIAQLIRQKGNNKANRAGRYIALALSDVEKAEALYEKHVDGIAITNQ